MLHLSFCVLQRFVPFRLNSSTFDSPRRRGGAISSRLGGMAKPKKAKAPAVDDDDALLDAAIAEKEAAVRKMQAEAKEKESAELALSAQLAAAKLGMQEQVFPRLGVKELVERMNSVPTFAIVNVAGGGKRHLPMRFADDEVTPQEVCAFFADPAEAKRALEQAQRACPDMELVLGAGEPAGTLTVVFARAMLERPTLRPYGDRVARQAADPPRYRIEGAARQGSARQEGPREMGHHRCRPDACVDGH